ncbi:hypothetical protein BC332_25091 [Capsicum chinense]|nr:hypothetical protein BC332_25091 [Capsicum chinense]
MVENNMCETFNSWIVGPRHKSMISMLEDIRHKIMDRHGDMIKFADTWTSDISPMARLVLEDNKEIGRKLTVNWNHDTGFEIQDGDYRHIVDLVKKTCTCRLWQLRGIPCKHPERSSERVISGGTAQKDASLTNIDLGFKPPHLK